MIISNYGTVGDTADVITYGKLHVIVFGIFEPQHLLRSIWLHEPRLTVHCLGIIVVTTGATSANGSVGKWVG